MEIEIERKEYQISHEQFIKGITEIIEMTRKTLETFRDSYRKTKDPLCKAEIEDYAGMLAELIKLLKKYTLRINNGIEVQPIVVFTDNKALFGYREKGDIEFSKRWYETIVRKDNHREMVS